MKVSENWLREWVSPSLTTDEIASQLTMAGLEVDGVEDLTPAFSKVVVGEITAIEQHPDADKLRVCQVSDGESISQVVCGAPNARLGIKVPFAQVGAVLPGNFKIKKAKLRGVESHGMLCAETELEIGTDNDGIMELPLEAPVGKSIAEYLDLNDKVIELDITPNRGDCFSMLGVARELGVLNQLDVVVPACAEVPSVNSDTFAVTLSAGNDCPSYAGRIIRNVDMSIASPLWMQEKLRRAGLRSIDAVVDVTNYVLIELGQPMHAFDLAKLNGSIDVRFAEHGEQLTLLDDQEIVLNKGSLVIADQTGPQALAGIMGGKDTSVTSATKDVFVESAFFTPHLIAGRARSYGLHTDTSLRYERGVDFAGQKRAIERATALLLSIVGGEPGPVVEIVNKAGLPDRNPVTLRKARIARVLGLEFTDTEVEENLTRLGMQVTAIPEGWIVNPPSWRFDIAIEADLLEELARLYGYNRLPVAAPTVALSLKEGDESKVELSRLRDDLISRGYSEAITYSFIAPELLAKFEPEATPVELMNPISADMAVMRTSLWPGLVSTVIHNLNRQQESVSVFESGLRFVKTGDNLVQDKMLAGALCGWREAENWVNKPEKVDFYDIKGDVQALLSHTCEAQAFSFEARHHHALHPGQSAAIIKDGKVIGWVGAMHPQLQQQLDLSETVFLFEIELAAIQTAKLPAFSELSKFPEVRRDIAVIVDESVTSDQVLNIIRKHGGEKLTDLTLFDIYRGKGIEIHRKSLALGLTFRDSSRTLKDEEINKIINQVIEALSAACGASLRN
jgi:phenylalanyl-tRNA synthetase beta chain